MSTVPTPEQLMALPPEYLAQDNGAKLNNTGIAFIVLLSVVYALFIISQMFFVERTGWTMWTLYPLGYLFSLSLAIICIFYIKIGGGGRHIAYWLIHDPSVIGTFLKLETASEFLYMAGITFPKIAILVLYLRIFMDHRVRIATWVVLGIVIGHFVFTGIIATFTICQPFAFKWDKSIPGGHCANLMAAYKYISIPNIVTDLAILALPYSTLRQLHTDKIQKYGIFVTFMAGGLGIVTSIIRFVGFYTTDLMSDLTYLGIDTMVYTLIEPSAYFICSCLLGIRPLIVTLFKKSRLSTAISNRYASFGVSSSKRRYELSDFSNRRNGHFVSASASKRRSMRSDDDDAGFIRLQETIHVDSMSIHSTSKGGAVRA
ncbi:hypothetical protein BGW36DRAFT_424810 [Talaromyces proteolyticus]|uniref:Rhodopsin domain-containing protein n=1 Tax=Talaromyces proteolyticus TaxID=1131652 RepID=A0AAD4KWM8_9EURO|nr:uncharacterized protein BGW36DRAFT_424810 [Talaromyces proteolyticus]KAH8702538.1 hypothetical protein BGW36DRAFT_424810 [Talaromyces proteolyticus]